MAQPLEFEAKVSARELNDLLANIRSQGEGAAKALNEALGGTVTKKLVLETVTDASGAKRLVAVEKERLSVTDAIAAAQAKLNKTQAGSATSLRGQLREATQTRDQIARTITVVDAYGRRVKVANDQWALANAKVRQINQELQIASASGFWQRLKAEANLGGLVSFGNGLTQITMALASATILVGQFTGAINTLVRAAAEVQEIGLTFRAIGQGALGGVTALQESARIAGGLGVSLDTVQDGFRQLAPVVLQSGGSLADVSEITETLSSRFVTFGISGDRARRVMNGVVQAFAKGKLMAEELTQQISEADPAFKTDLARAIGKSVQELERMVKAGDLTTEFLIENIPKLSKSSILFGKLGTSAQDATGALENQAVTIDQVRAKLEVLGKLNLRELAQLAAPLIQGFLEIQAIVTDLITNFQRLAISKTLVDALALAVDIGKQLLQVISTLALGLGTIASALSPLIDLLLNIPGIAQIAAAAIGVKLLSALGLVGQKAQVLSNAWAGLKQTFADTFSAARRETYGFSDAAQKALDTARNASFPDIASDVANQASSAATSVGNANAAMARSSVTALKLLREEYSKALADAGEAQAGAGSPGEGYTNFLKRELEEAKRNLAGIEAQLQETGERARALRTNTGEQAGTGGESAKATDEQVRKIRLLGAVTQSYLARIDHLDEAIDAGFSTNQINNFRQSLAQGRQRVIDMIAAGEPLKGTNGIFNGLRINPDFIAGLRAISAENPSKATDILGGSLQALKATIEDLPADLERLKSTGGIIDADAERILKSYNDGLRELQSLAANVQSPTNIANESSVDELKKLEKQSKQLRKTQKELENTIKDLDNRLGGRLEATEALEQANQRLDAVRKAAEDAGKQLINTFDKPFSITFSGLDEVKSTIFDLQDSLDELNKVQQDAAADEISRLKEARQEQLKTLEEIKNSRAELAKTGDPLSEVGKGLEAKQQEIEAGIGSISDEIRALGSVAREGSQRNDQLSRSLLDITEKYGGAEKRAAAFGSVMSGLESEIANYDAQIADATASVEALTLQQQELQKATERVPGQARGENYDQDVEKLQQVNTQLQENADNVARLTAEKQRLTAQTNAFAAATQNGSKPLDDLGIKAIAAAGAAEGLQRQTLSLGAGLRNLGGAVRSGVGNAFNELAGSLGILEIGFIAVGVAASAYASFNRGAAEATKKSQERVEALGKALKDVTGTDIEIQADTKGFETTWSNIGQTVAGAVDFISGSLEWLNEGVSKIGTGLVTSTGQVGQFVSGLGSIASSIPGVVIGMGAAAGAALLLAKAIGTVTVGAVAANAALLGPLGIAIGAIAAGLFLLSSLSDGEAARQAQIQRANEATADGYRKEADAAEKLAAALKRKNDEQNRGRPQGPDGKPQPPQPLNDDTDAAAARSLVQEVQRQEKLVESLTATEKEYQDQLQQLPPIVRTTAGSYAALGISLKKTFLNGDREQAISEIAAGLGVTRKEAEAYLDKEIKLRGQLKNTNAELETQKTALDRKTAAAESAAKSTGQLTTSQLKVARTSGIVTEKLKGAEESLGNLDPKISPDEWNKATDRVAGLTVELEQIKSYQDLSVSLKIAAKVDESLKNGGIQKTISNAQLKLKALNDAKTKLDVDSSQFVDVVQNIAKTELDLKRVEEKETLIKVGIIIQELAPGKAEQTVSNIQSRLSALNTKKTLLNIDSAAFDGTIADIFQAERQLDEFEKKERKVKIRLLIEGINGGSIEESIQNLQAKLSGIEQSIAEVDINSPDLPLLISDLLEAQNEVDALNGRRAEVTVELREQNGYGTTTASSLTQIGRALSDLEAQKATIPIDSSEVDVVAGRIERLQLLQELGAKSTKQLREQIWQTEISLIQKAQEADEQRHAATMKALDEQARRIDENLKRSQKAADAAIKAIRDSIPDPEDGPVAREYAAFQAKELQKQARSGDKGQRLAARAQLEALRFAEERARKEEQIAKIEEAKQARAEAAEREKEAIAEARRQAEERREQAALQAAQEMQALQREIAESQRVAAQEMIKAAKEIIALRQDLSGITGGGTGAAAAPAQQEAVSSAPTRAAERSNIEALDRTAQSLERVRAAYGETTAAANAYYKAQASGLDLTGGLLPDSGADPGPALEARMAEYGRRAGGSFQRALTEATAAGDLQAFQVLTLLSGANTGYQQSLSSLTTAQQQQAAAQQAYNQALASGASSGVLTLLRMQVDTAAASVNKFQQDVNAAKIVLDTFNATPIGVDVEGGLPSLDPVLSDVKELQGAFQSAGFQAVDFANSLQQASNADVSQNLGEAASDASSLAGSAETAANSVGGIAEQAGGLQEALGGSQEALSGVSEASQGVGAGLENAASGAGTLTEAAIEASEGISEGVGFSENLKSELGSAADEAGKIASRIKGLDGMTVTIRVNVVPSRWTGGPVEGGKSYQVNELGQEGFLSAAGTLTPIRRPRNAMWRAPGRGTVVPAHIWKDINAPTGRVGPTLAPPAPRATRADGIGGVLRSLVGALNTRPQQSPELREVAAVQAEQAIQIGKLSRAIDDLAAKDWNVNVDFRSYDNRISEMRMRNRLT